MSKRKLVLCSSQVKKDAIKREVIDGVEHIIVSSYTLPDNVVMNGGLYPAEEIATSYKQLERTLAPVEHPTDKEGNFIPATDPFALHNFYAGAYNMNVTKEGNRIHVEKYINVQEAMKSDRGKRLLDRINEIETNENPRPIHTSTGLFLEMETLDKPVTNEAGDDYTWIARNMVFDHDAILLDSVGAAQPHQGVGMAVNAEGDQVEVERIEVSVTTVDDETPQPSVLGIKEQLETEVRNLLSFEWLTTVDMIGDQYIFETDKGYFQVPFQVEGADARIVGIPIRCDRKVTYTPKVNEEEGDAMKELMLKALADAGITVNADISDELLLAKYTELQANQSQGDDDGATGDDIATVVANAVANAVKPVADELEGLKTQLNSKATAEKEEFVNIIVNSGKYPGLDTESASLLPAEKLKEMAANCGVSYGLPVMNGQNFGSDEFKDTVIPE